MPHLQAWRLVAHRCHDVAAQDVCAACAVVHHPVIRVFDLLQFVAKQQLSGFG